MSDWREIVYYGTHDNIYLHDVTKSKGKILILPEEVAVKLRPLCRVFFREDQVRLVGSERVGVKVYRRGARSRKYVLSAARWPIPGGTSFTVIEETENSITMQIQSYA